MAGNIFQDGMQAYASTDALISGIQKKRADYQAAPMIAAGNFGGAARAYGGAGLADEARQNVVDQQVMQDRSAAADTKAKTAEAQRRADGLLHVVDAVQAAPAGQRLARLQALAPAMHGMGVEPGQLGAATEADLTDDKLASFKALLGKAAQDYTLGPGQIRVSGGANQVIASAPKPQEYLVLPEGGRAIPKPMNGETVGNPAPPAFAPTPSSAPAAPASSQSRGVRNNNPLNITGQGWQGQTGSDGQYAVFSSPEAGQQAADKNLQAYATRHGINTLSGIISRWAPASGGNDTASYIQTVASDLNIDPNQPLNLADPKVRAVVLHSMSKVELGGQAPTPHQAAPAAVSGGPQPGDPAGTLYGNPKPVQWTSDGKGFLRNANGDVKPDPSADMAGSADPNIVKMVLRGDYPVPTGRAATDPKWQAVVEEAARQDPTFSAANYATRVATRKSFTSGKDADQIKSLNTAIGHAASMAASIDAMGDTPVPGFNMFKNAVEGGFGQNIAAKPYNINKDALMHEGLRLFSGTGGGLTEFKSLADQLDYNDNPKTQHAVLEKLVGLFASRMDALASKYEGGMGLQADGLEFLNPKAQKAYAKLMGVDPPSRHDIATSSTAGAESAPASAPGAQAIPTLSPQDAAKLPKGSKFRTTDGRVLVRQ